MTVTAAARFVSSRAAERPARPAPTISTAVPRMAISIGEVQPYGGAVGHRLAFVLPGLLVMNARNDGRARVEANRWLYRDGNGSLTRKPQAQDAHGTIRVAQREVRA